MERYNRNRIRLAVSRSAREYRSAVEDRDLAEVYIGNRVLPAAVRYLHHALLTARQETDAERRALERLGLCRQVDGAFDFLASSDEASLTLFGKLCDSECLDLVDVSAHSGIEIALQFAGSTSNAGLGVVSGHVVVLTPFGKDLRQWLLDFEVDE